MALDLIWPYCIPALSARCDTVLNHMLKMLTRDIMFGHVELLDAVFGDACMYLRLMPARSAPERVQIWGKSGKGACGHRTLKSTALYPQEYGTVP
jgi:hypothetical protein